MRVDIFLVLLFASVFFGKELRIDLPDHIDQCLGCHADIFVFVVIVTGKVLNSVFVHEIGQLTVHFSDCVQADRHRKLTATVVDKLLDDVFDNGFDLVIRD